MHLHSFGPSSVAWFVPEASSVSSPGGTEPPVDELPGGLNPPLYLLVSEISRLFGLPECHRSPLMRFLGTNCSQNSRYHPPKQPGTQRSAFPRSSRVRSTRQEPCQGGGSFWPWHSSWLGLPSPLPTPSQPPPSANFRHSMVTTSSLRPFLPHGLP